MHYFYEPFLVARTDHEVRVAADRGILSCVHFIKISAASLHMAKPTKLVLLPGVEPSCP